MKEHAQVFESWSFSPHVTQSPPVCETARLQHIDVLVLLRSPAAVSGLVARGRTAPPIGQEPVSLRQ